VIGAMAVGTIHDFNVFNAGTMDRGGYVEGVSMSLVRAMSMGARIMPARPEADTVAKRAARGAGDERMSIPVREEGPGRELPADRDMPGSGRARTAQIKERRKVVSVERRTLWMNVLFVPFQTPHAPSCVQSVDSALVIEVVEGRLCLCGDPC
jgi:hypothetical protein